MQILNIHECAFDAESAEVGSLIDSLSSEDDRLWPKHIWPRMEFDRSLSVGAMGEHGPIRYFVEQYTPGKAIRFRFTGPKGFDGFHAFEVIAGTNNSVALKHTLKMDTHGLANVSWPLIFRPMHDALIEDSFTAGQQSLGLSPQVRTWSLGVRVLRWVISGGKTRPQDTPKKKTAPGRNYSRGVS